MSYLAFGHPDVVSFHQLVPLVHPVDPGDLCVEVLWVSLVALVLLVNFLLDRCVFLEK